MGGLSGIGGIYNSADLENKKKFLTYIFYLIMQSKPQETDIQLGIELSYLKPTYTPCVLIQKGLSTAILHKILNLPENDLKKAFILFLTLFKIAYRRRFVIEKDNPDKWWYWDLTDETKIAIIMSSLQNFK